MNVKLQRLQEITVESALAEGIVTVKGHVHPLYRLPGYVALFQDPITAYRYLWDSLNNTYLRHWSWDSNPFVYEITFRRLAP